MTQRDENKQHTNNTNKMNKSNMNMPFLTLSNGLQMPAIGFGTWRARGEEARQAVEHALRAGYRHIDTAARYENEEFVGQAIRRAQEEGTVQRKDLFVTTKVWNTERGYDRTLRACHDSLQRLGLDYVDLLLVHWPASPHQRNDWREVNADTWRAMEQLLRDGHVKSIGVSNFMEHHLQPLLDTAEVAPMVNQIEVHPGYTQAALVDWCQSRGIVVEAWRPLGKGELMQHPVVQQVAEAHPGFTPAQVCLAWLLQRGIAPLPKSTHAERIAENLGVLGLTLTTDEMHRLYAVAPFGGEEHPDRVDF